MKRLLNKIMKPNDIVSFRLAKKLKEKGYPQQEKDWFGSYYNSKGEYYSLGETKDLQEKDYPIYFAPILFQVQKWLREEKYIHVTPEYITGNKLQAVYICSINIPDEQHDSDRYIEVEGDFVGYENALIAGIEEAIKLI